MIYSSLLILLMTVFLMNFRDSVISQIQNVLIFHLGTGMIGSNDPYRRHLAASIHCIVVLTLLLSSILFIVKV